MNLNFYFFRINPVSKFLFVFLTTLSVNTIAIEESELNGNRIDADWEIASNTDLDSQRGGFALPNGVVFDFSFEKIIYSNGVEVFSSVFELPTNIQIVENGGLHINNDYGSAVLNSVIQNNLDNQEITTVNTINIDISNFNNIDDINRDIMNTEVFTNIMTQTLVR